MGLCVSTISQLTHTLHQTTQKQGSTMNTIETSISSSCEVERKLDKHITLYGAIERIKMINELLEALMARVENRELILEEAVPSYTPTLLDVLTNGADLIHSKIDEAEQRIEQLTRMLF